MKCAGGTGQPLLRIVQCARLPLMKKGIHWVGRSATLYTLRKQSFNSSIHIATRCLQRPDVL
jgi:hypothetical protein